MKREVWVEMPEVKEHLATARLIVHGRTKPVLHETLHESRWIPVSEKPEREGRYPVVFDSQREFEGSSSYWDGNNWCGPVKLWLEAPPLPVTKEVKTTDERFKRWYNYIRDAVNRENVKGMDYFKFIYESARGEDVNLLPVECNEDEFKNWVSSFKITAITSLEDCMKSAWNAAKESK